MSFLTILLNMQVWLGALWQPLNCGYTSPQTSMELSAYFHRNKAWEFIDKPDPFPNDDIPPTTGNINYHGNWATNNEDHSENSTKIRWVYTCICKEFENESTVIFHFQLFIEADVRNVCPNGIKTGSLIFVCMKICLMSEDSEPSWDSTEQHSKGLVNLILIVSPEQSIWDSLITSESYEAKSDHAHKNHCMWWLDSNPIMFSSGLTQSCLTYISLIPMIDVLRQISTSGILLTKEKLK